jgi:hypothetical protein
MLLCNDRAGGGVRPKLGALPSRLELYSSHGRMEMLVPLLVDTPTIMLASEPTLRRRFTDIDKSDLCVRFVYPWVLTHAGQQKAGMSIANILDHAHQLYYTAAVRSGMHPVAGCRAACALIPLWAEDMCQDRLVREEAMGHLRQMSNFPA